MSLQETLFEQLDKDESDIIKTRRYLHEYPELYFKEKESSEYIKQFYANFGMKAENCGDGYGLIVDIDSGKPGKTIALRADFDALPVTEDNHLDFKSKHKGVMHACGHDGHAAYLMYLAKNLYTLKEHLTGKVRIIHQPAEEQAPGGALGMIKGGCLDGIEHVLGLHVMSTMETDTIQYHAGYTQTGRSNFTLDIIGAGGHASQPHLANDSVVAGSYFVNAIQTIVSRNLDPYAMGVITIGSFDGVGGSNVINKSVTLQGDVRYTSDTVKETIEKRVREIVSGLETMFQVTSHLEYTDNYPALYNDPAFTEYVAKTITKAHIPQVTKVLDCGPQTPSEDFSYYAQKVPSSFIYAGCDIGDGQPHPHHSPNFLMDERALLIAAKAIGCVTIDYLSK